MREIAKLYSDTQIVEENNINGLLYGAELCGDFSAEASGKPARTGYNIIILVTHGSLSYVIGRQEFKADCPAIRVIPSGSGLNSVSYSGGFRGCIVKVCDELMMDIIRNNNPFPLESIYRLYDNKHSNVNITRDECDTLLADMRNMIAAMGKKRHHFLHELNYAHLYILTSDILALLRENIDRQHSVTFYAGELCISKQYLSAVVKEKTKTTTGKIIAKARAEKALQMLRETELSIKEIADRLAFPDQSTFGKFFKKQFGESPLGYRSKITRVAPLNKGLSRSDWGLRWEGPTGPHRSVSEVSCMGTEAAQVPAQRSGAACPTGAVTAGDWG